MKKMKFQVAALSMLLVLGSCQTKTGTGAAVGAGSGAALGAIVGGLLNNSHRGTGALVGAAIGAAVGGGTGALIGKRMDKVAAEAKQIYAVFIFGQRQQGTIPPPGGVRI